MAESSDGGLTSFVWSHSLPSSPVSQEGDATFSILPRYLLQKVKSTFGATTATSSSHASGSNASSLAGDAPTASTSKPGSSRHNSNGTNDSIQPMHNLPGKKSAELNARIHPISTRAQSPSLRDSSTVSRNPRLSTLAGHRRAVAPVLSKTVSESGNFASFQHNGSVSLSRSHSRSLGTLPESPTENSPPPPPYSFNANYPFSSIPGFPLNRDPNEDAKSVSSIAGPTLGVAQIFRRLRGEALSRDYWMSDESAVDCYDCNTTFTAWRRKHHCRVCGRIFCSRCASNIIPGARFGHEGLVRVCNLCLAILKHEVERGVPHKSVAPAEDISFSERPGLTSSGSVANMNISLPLESSFRAPQAQFSASVLFPRNDFSSYNLAANLSSEDLSQLNNSKRGRRFSDASLARPETPDMFEESASPTPWHPTLGSPFTAGFRDSLNTSIGASSPLIHATTPAPFRKTAADEDKALPSPQPNTSSSDASPLSSFVPPAHDSLANGGLGIFSPTIPAVLEPSLANITGSVHFESSYENSLSGGPTTASGTARPETPSAASYLPANMVVPHIRSRMNSRAADQVFDLADIDTRRLSEVNYLPQLFRTQSRSMSFVNDVELAAAALAHVRRLLIQCLKQAEVPKAHIWEEELLRILVKVATYPLPKVKEGDSMDVRRYIKIKRVPGGTPADSEYVDGIVFTKSMLNKSLPTFISHPRIMVFNYAFEFEHDETKMARLDTLRDSEKDSLRKLANSIIDHRPHVVLVGKNVSGLALDYLHKANIVVARNVKPSVLEIVARCTRAGIFNTYQHFPETTRLGRCQVFRSDTIVHNLIPGKRKTLLRFEGCSRDLGGTVILRGGDVATLSKIKRIMHFMVLAVYSARLEMCLFWDEHAAIPPAIELSRLREAGQDKHAMDLDMDYFSSRESEDQPQDTAQKEIDKLIKQTLRPYTSTILSTSPTIIFPPPHSLERLRIDNDRIEELRTHHRQERTITHGSELSMQQAHQSQPQQESFAAPVTVSKGGEPEAALQTSAALTRSLSEVSLLSVKPQTKTKVLKISAELAEASQIAEAQKKRDEHLAIWENRLARHQDDLHPAAHQHLSILETVICATTLKACDGPRLVRRYFYNKTSDLTLRQYIERTVLASSHRCPAKGCEKPMLAHYTTYAHGEQRLHMVLESYPFVRQNPEDILLWSYCKICSTTTDVTSLSDEASNYSFAKYLEVSFHHGQLYCRELSCPHNIHRDHFRYFAYRNMAIRIWVDPIDVSDVSIPPLQIRIDPWTQLRVKNDEYRELQKIVTSYWDSVIARIRAFNHELLPADRAEAGRIAMQALSETAEADRQTFARMLDKAYEDAEVNKPSSMNVVRHALMKKINTWDNDFITFEQKYIPSDAERARRMTSTHLRRLFSDPNSSVPNSPDLRGNFSPMPSVPSSPLYGTGGFGDTTHVPYSLAQLAGLGLAPSEAGSLTPSSVSETSSTGESATGSSTYGESGSSSKLTAANLAQIVEDAFSEQATDLDSIVDHGETGPTSSVIKSNQREGSDSDSTVCAEPIVTRRAIEDFDSMRSESEDIDTALAMRPYKVRKAKAVPSIANLVQRFESPEAIQPEASRLRISILPMSSSHRATVDATHKSPNRPGLRRGKSDYTEIKNTKAKQAKDERNNVLSDGDAPVPASAPAASTMANRPSRLPRSPRTRPTSPVTSKRRPPLDSRTSSSSQLSGRLDVPASQRPSMLTRTSTMSSRTTVAGSGIRKRTQEQGVTSDSANDDGRVSSMLKLPTRDAKSVTPTAASGLAVKIPRRTTAGAGPGPNSRVTTMARHFNQLSRDAERERQRQLLLARRKTARPVLVPRATANFFVSSKEALKDDSDDDGSSSGADDEMGPGEDDEAEPPKVATPQPIALKGASEISAERPFRYDLPLESRPGALSASSTSSDLSLQASEGTSNTDPIQQIPAGASTDSGPSVPPSPQVSGTLSAVPRLSHLSESEMSSTGTETRSLMKTLSNLWNYRGADFIPLEYPNMGVEHLVEGSNIVMREDEPSSIIAQGLNSPAYKAALREGMPASVASSAEAFMPDQPLGHGINRASNWDVLDFQTDPGTDLEEAMKKPANQIMRVVWDGEHVRCTMKVFFAHQFDALRKNCDIEELFIESLARCVKWDAVGGKSGSAFLKTRDDRFIIKEISPVEMNALIHFAPKYFEYMSRAFFHDLPTVMAKILGVYRLSVKNIQTGKAQKMDVLVMENIYYGKTITRQYDLKGSLRNRHVEVSDSKTCVLLDENLIEMAYDRPLYVREHTKKHLETALYNDSLFLSNNKVMDYSLIVGVDKDSRELVVGIIDFLRPYTWDKRLETWVKETAYMGGGHREPTILNPRIYKNRFREAMSRYFVLVPDAWTSAEAIETGQPLPNATPLTGTKDKSKQTGAADEQPEQYAGSSSRAHSPATLRKLVPLVNGGR